MALSRGSPRVAVSEPPCPAESGLSSAIPEGIDAAARPARPRPGLYRRLLRVAATGSMIDQPSASAMLSSRPEVTCTSTFAAARSVSPAATAS